jgi:hypothetical protein
MDNVSSVIDGSIAMAGVIAAFAVSGWALMSAEPTGTVEKEEAKPTTVKKAA